MNGMGLKGLYKGKETGVRLETQLWYASADRPL